MAKITIFSNRIYKNKLNIETVSSLNEILHIHNEAKIKAYSILAYDKPLDQSIHLTIKEMFELNTYYANFAVSEAKWNISSNIELQKLYISDTEDNIKHRKEKIKRTNNKIKYWQKIHKYIIDISKAIKNNNKLPKLKTFMPYYFFLEGDKILVEATYRTKTIIYNLYDFEHTVVVKKIKRLKNKLNHLQRGVNNQEQKLQQLKTENIRSCFGSKKLFKSQHTIYDDHSKWKEDFHKARHSNIELQGLNTVDQGNACVKYNYESNTLKIQLPYENKVGKYHKAEWFSIEGVDFPYRKDALIEALNTKGVATSWRVEDHADYYLFKATVELFRDEEYINYSKEDGVISYDINYNHVAWSNLDQKGNLIDYGTIHFDIENKTTGQISKILEKVAIDLVKVAKDNNKPLAGEDIKAIKKSTLTYGNKKRNLRISRFAHSKLISAIASRAYKEYVEVYYVNPAYTSQMGKLKYMKAKGLSIHTSASYCIGRKALGHEEKIPKAYRGYENKWTTLASHFKDLKTHYLYNIPNPIDHLDIKDYVKKIIIKNYNQKNKPVIYFKFA